MYYTDGGFAIDKDCLRGQSTAEPLLIGAFATEHGAVL
jgi:hypothetical protein